MAKDVYSLIGIYHKPESSGFGRAGGQWWQWTRGTSAASTPVTGSGLDSNKPNAAIGLVTRVTSSIMAALAGSHLVLGEVGGAMTGWPGLTPHAYIPIDSDARHFETEADKENCKTECCRHHRQPAWHANEWQHRKLTCGFLFQVQPEMGSRLRSDMTGYISYFWEI